MGTGLNFTFWYLEEGIKGAKFDILTISPFSTLSPSPLSKAARLRKPVNQVNQRDPPLERPSYTLQYRVPHNFSKPEIQCAIPFKNRYFSIHIGIAIQYKLNYCKRPIYIQSQKKLGTLFNPFPIFDLWEVLFLIEFQRLLPLTCFLPRFAHSYWLRRSGTRSQSKKSSTITNSSRKFSTRKSTASQTT